MVPQVSNGNMIYTSALAHIEKVFHDRYDLSSTIRHRGERGRQRENDLLVFLRENLPLAYGVGTGEIISFRGNNVSPQCDIIIYDQLNMPIIGRNDAVQRVPLEAVYAVIECKSSVDKQALTDANKKFSTIHRMPRCSYDAHLRKGMIRGPVFGLFGYKLRTDSDNCINFMTKTARKGATFCTSLDSGCGIWVGGNRSIPLWVKATDKKQQQYETLALFFVDLLLMLQVVDLGKPRLVQMLLSTD